MGRLDGRVAIVTGAGGGIGREHALLLGREGAAVVVDDIGSRTGSDAAGVAAEIRAAGGTATSTTASAPWDGAAEIVQKIAAGETTCEAVTRDCVARIAERDGVVKAWVSFDPELALAQGFPAV